MRACRLFCVKLLTALATLGLCTSLYADVLLVGEASGDGEASLAFSLSGNSRTDVVGGTIVFGDATYEITHVSVHNLIGGKREHDGQTEYVIFSSSFSPVTATGQPWVASEQYFACDQQYNSFLARYQVGDAAGALPEAPFKQLADSLSESDRSEVFCFVSAPEGR